MKIRNGFVSNSSSSSFVLIGNTPSQDSKQYGKTFTRTSTSASKNSTVHNDYEILHIEDYEGETSYCRSNIMWVSSITGKIRYIMAIYARYYENDPNYFQKVLDARNKIFKLGIKHWYSIVIPIPPLFARYERDWDEENRKILDTKHIETYVNIYTECCYAKDIVKMIEDEDTSLLDRFIFSSNSFCVLGGDEYDETYKLQRKAVEVLNVLRNENPDFSYKMFADYEDHNADDVYRVDKDGTELKWGYDYHWEKDCFEHGEWYDEDGYDEVEIIYD